MKTTIRSDLPKVEWRPWTADPFPFSQMEEQNRLEREILESKASPK